MAAVTTGMVLTAGMMVIISCDDVSGPSEPGEWFGWAVGEPADGYACILATGDGGVNWNRQGNGDLPDVMIESIRAVDSLTAWAVGDPADGYGTILRTDDGGQSWTRQGSAASIPDKGLNGIAVMDRNTAIVVGIDNTVLYTSDAGGTWTSVSDPRFDGYDYGAVSALDHSTVWAVGGTEHSGIIIKSIDGGTSWEAQGDSLLLSGYPLIGISVMDASRVWVAGHGYTVASTDDGGTSWDLKVPEGLNRSPLSDDANDVCALSPGWVLLTIDYGNAYVTTDWGQSWTKQTVTVGDFLLDCCAMDNGYAWIASTSAHSVGGNILRTSTGGPIWFIQDLPVNADLRDVSFVDAHH